METERFLEEMAEVIWKNLPQKIMSKKIWNKAVKTSIKFISELPGWPPAKLQKASYKGEPSKKK